MGYKESRKVASERWRQARKDSGEEQAYRKELYLRRKEVEKEQQRKRYERFVETHGKNYWSEQSRKWRKNNPVQYMLLRARSRAKKAGLEFSITAVDIVIPDVCPLLGIPLAYTAGTEGNTQEGKDDSPSLDRIDSTKGYVPGNVWVISNRANKIKSDATITELENIVAGLKNQRFTT